MPKVEALAAVIALFERVFGEDSGLAAADLVEGMSVQTEAGYGPIKC